MIAPRGAEDRRRGPDADSRQPPRSPKATAGHIPSRTKQSLADQAYAAIKEHIVAGDLRPGRVFPAQGLAEGLKMSQTPIREALNRLCHERLVQVIPRTGYMVAPVTVNEVQDVFQLRLAVEPLAAELAVNRATDLELAAFRETVIPTKRSTDPTASSSGGLHANQWATHDAFHLAVAAAANHPQLFEITADLLTKSRRIYLLTSAHFGADKTGTEPTFHDRIAEAVIARDGGAAAKTMAEHVRRSYQTAIDSLADGLLHSSKRNEPLAN